MTDSNKNLSEFFNGLCLFLFVGIGGAIVLGFALTVGLPAWLDYLGR